MTQGISRKNFKVFILSFAMALIFCLTKCHIGISSLKNFVSYISLGLSIIVYFSYIKKKKFSKFVIAFLLYLIILLFSTIVNAEASISLIVKNYYLILSIILFFDMLDYQAESSKFVIKGWYYAFYLVTFINFITVILYPNGLYKNSIYTNNWFLGYDNTHICFFLSTFLFMILKNFFEKKSFNVLDLLCIGIVVFQVVFCFSANSVVSLFLLFLLFILEQARDFLKYFDIKKMYIIYIIFILLFVIFRIQKKFEFIIVNLLGKKLDFSGRVVIWDRVIELINRKKILGYGQEKINIISSKLGNPAFAHAHNTILDIAYKSGLIGLFLHSLLHFFAIKELFKMRKYKITRYISAVLFAFMILTIMEARQENFNMYIILIFSFNIKRIIKGGIYE